MPRRRAVRVLGGAIVATAVPSFWTRAARAGGTAACSGTTPKTCDNGTGSVICIGSDWTCCYFKEAVVGCKPCFKCAGSYNPTAGCVPVDANQCCAFDHPVLGRQARRLDPKTQCCTPRSVQPKLEGFSARACKETLTKRPKSEKYKPSKNGCGSKDFDVADTWPAKGPGKKASFTPACNKHDVCYGTCKKDKDACDKAFCLDLKKACKNTWPNAGDSKRRDGCESRADLYCAGVILAGDAAYWNAQEEACHCCK